MTNFLRLILAAAAVALIPACDRGNVSAPPDPAPAPWPAVNTAICVASNDQQAPQMVSDGSGGAIIVWQDNRGATGMDIYAQRVNGSGTLLWSLNGIPICTSADEQSHPVIASDGAGGAIIAWQDRRGGANFDIYAQRVNGAGTRLWTAGGVAVCTATLDQVEQQMVSDGAGGAIIVWTDYRTQPPLPVYAQRINGSGVSLWTTDGVPLTTLGVCGLPQIVSDGASGAVVSWQDNRDLGSTVVDIYAQRVSASGTRLWTDGGVAICTAADYQLEAQLASDGAGGAFVVWEDARTGQPNYRIYAQHVSGAGAVVWTANGLPLSTTTDYQVKPQVAPDGAGGAIAVWQHSTGSTVQIYAQRVTAAGSMLWAAGGAPVTATVLLRSLPQIASDGSGGAVLVWEDWRNGADFDIYAQRLNDSGMPQWTANGVALCTASGSQNLPRIVTDASARSIIVWEDHRPGSTSDIYAQGVDAAGVP